MRKQDYPIQLSNIERMELEAIVRKGQQKARVIRRAQTLLWSDAGKSDLEIAELYGIRPLTVAKTRERSTLAVSTLVQRLKGTSSRKLLQEYTELRKRYWGRHLWARGYFAVSTGNVTDEVIR